MKPVSSDARRLIDSLGRFPRTVVAFSGGVDSSVVAAAAHRANGTSAVAVTAHSPSVPQWQLDVASRVAHEIGIEHRVVQTFEGDRDDYRRNDGQRCFYCKETLYQTLRQIAQDDPQATIVSGTNADDLGDYRPGISAGRLLGVVTPLADLGFTKAQVRGLARFFALSNQDLPASPCLASRVAYGTEVTPERLKRIEQAESFLRGLGFNQLRVRLHEGEQARIEVEQQAISALLDLDLGGQVTQKLLSLGFQGVTIDRQGFRSGSMNHALVSPVVVSLGEPASRLSRKMARQPTTADEPFQAPDPRGATR